MGWEGGAITGKELTDGTLFLVRSLAFTAISPINKSKEIVPMRTSIDAVLDDLSSEHIGLRSNL